MASERPAWVWGRCGRCVASGPAMQCVGEWLLCVRVGDVLGVVADVPDGLGGADYFAQNPEAGDAGGVGHVDDAQEAGAGGVFQQGPVLCRLLAVVLAEEACDDLGAGVRSWTA